jgi:hypothetical protein
VSTDAGSAFDANASLVFGAVSTAVKGSKRKRFGPFQISSHAVVGRLACLIVIPALSIFNVTPSPE